MTIATDPDTRPYYLWFSEQHHALMVKQGRGVCIWATEDGGEAAVTCVTRERDGGRYVWPDKVYLARGTCYLRTELSNE